MQTSVPTVPFRLPFWVLCYTVKRKIVATTMTIFAANVAVIDAVVAIDDDATPDAVASAATAVLEACQPWSVSGGNCHLIS